MVEVAPPYDHGEITSLAAADYRAIVDLITLLAQATRRLTDWILSSH